MSDVNHSEFGRRAGVSLLAPAPGKVDCSAVVIEAYERPHLDLPEGWESMTEDEIRNLSMERQRKDLAATFRLPAGWEAMTEDELEAWAGAYVERHGLVANPIRQAGEDVSLKGGFDDPWPPYEYGIPEGFTVLSLLDAATPERSTTWFPVRSDMSMYRDAEQAAAHVIYHEDEPVTAETPAVAWDAYPGSWDRPAVESRQTPGRPLPRPDLAGDVGRYERLRSYRPVRNWVETEPQPPTPDWWQPGGEGDCWVCGASTPWMWLDQTWQHLTCDSWPSEYVDGRCVIVIDGVGRTCEHGYDHDHDWEDDGQAYVCLGADDDIHTVVV